MITAINLRKVNAQTIRIISYIHVTSKNITFTIQTLKLLI